MIDVKFTCLTLAAVMLALTSLVTSSRANTFYFFQGQTATPPDGGVPEAPLINVNGVFYGTTSRGGANGYGTVYSVTGTTVHVLYSFQGPPNDGAGPEGGLVAIGNVLYGTTRYGGANTGGTVFSVPVFGGFDHVLHSFGAGNDGLFPAGQLINVGSDLYGTTAEGGTGSNCPNTTSFPSCGTVFRLSICGCGGYSVLYSFKGPDFNDGSTPYGGVTYWHDAANNADWLYGTTSHGGNGGPSCQTLGGCGTIFRLPLSGGPDTIQHSFHGGSDGENPYNTGGLLIVGSRLYGTTYYGGNSYGTVFRQPLSGGNVQILGTFNGVDGGYPAGSLIYWRDPSTQTDWLYGTTLTGGTGTCSYPPNCGLAFKMPLAGGAPATLVTFAGPPSDGGHPYSGLTYWHDGPHNADWFYGTTQEGGSANCPNQGGCGSLFRIHP